MDVSTHTYMNTPTTNEVEIDLQLLLSYIELHRRIYTNGQKLSLMPSLEVHESPANLVFKLSYPLECLYTRMASQGGGRWLHSYDNLPPSLQYTSTVGHCLPVQYKLQYTQNTSLATPNFTLPYVLNQ